jgi:hypothetical protein
MFSTYEIKRGNRRLLRLARILEQVRAGTSWRRVPKYVSPLTAYAHFTPSRWTTDKDGIFGRRKWVRSYENFSKARMESARKEFALSDAEATSLFGPWLSTNPTRKQIESLVRFREAR